MDKKINQSTEQNALPQENALDQAKAKHKKAYAKPQVLFHAPLEAMAATCNVFPGKVQGVCGTAFS